MMRLFFVALVAFVLVACRKDPPITPEKVSLSSPANNEACVPSNIISETQSTVRFSWLAALNTDSYTLHVKNLKSGQTTTFEMADKLTKDLPLERGVPYSWSVVSRSDKSGKETSSDAWKFYNPAPAATSYPPFPAELVLPKYQEVIASTVEKVNLSWTGSDPDNDIQSYDIYLGTSANPEIYKTGITTSTLPDLQLTRPKRYYWKVQTIDKRGNKSTSDIYTFLLN